MQRRATERASERELFLSLKRRRKCRQECDRRQSIFISFGSIFSIVFSLVPLAACSMAALVLPSGWTDAKYGLLVFAFVGELVQGEESEMSR